MKYINNNYNNNFCLINFLNITIVLNFQQNIAFPTLDVEDLFGFGNVMMHLLLFGMLLDTLVDNLPLSTLESLLIDAAPKNRHKQYFDVNLIEGRKLCCHVPAVLSDWPILHEESAALEVVEPNMNVGELKKYLKLVI